MHFATKWNMGEEQNRKEKKTRFATEWNVAEEQNRKDLQIRGDESQVKMDLVTLCWVVSSDLTLIVLQLPSKTAVELQQHAKTSVFLNLFKNLFCVWIVGLIFEMIE